MLPAGHTAFSHELRLLICAHCGAALPAPTNGGQTRCTYCGTVSVLAPRNEQAEVAQFSQRPRLPEQDRMQRLRLQDGRPLLPPAYLHQHLVGGRLPAERVPEVLREWSAARAEVAATRSPMAEERLYFLTLFLMAPLGLAQDHVRQRAVIESATEVLSLPGYKLSLRCQLARLAARTGDLAAAEDWLALVDPASESLDVDSEYRCARAQIATARGDFHEVLRQLGSNALEIPIADSLDLLAGVLRANAFERLGRLDLATAVLAGLRGQGHTKRDIETVREANRALDLCPQSIATVASDGLFAGGFGRGCGLVAMLLPFLLLSGGFFVGAAMVSPDAKTDDGYAMSSFLVFMGACFAIPSLFIGIFMAAVLRKR
jgi:DNA-directed RNA polymerase subunit RPC12/RpoP